MPPRTRRLPFPDHLVTAVVVVHDGERWLEECLQALRAQTRPPQRVVAVDTGSADGSVGIAVAALGESAVITCARDTGLGAAVQAGVDAFAGAPASVGVAADATPWIWVLHDDCAPDTDALHRLLERAHDTASAAVVAPKLLTWDRDHLLEVGLTVDSSGHRDTGLERHEVDQGQHDDVHDVLAAGTAGLLVRGDTWDRLGGLDRTWPLFADDIDFGWRVNAAGARVVVAPQAVVRHVGALGAGLRRADAVRLPPGAAARAHGMQVVLANTSAWLVVPLLLRDVVESVLAAIVGLLLLRSPRRARDELLALGSVVVGIPRVVRARRARRPLREVPHRALRPLLAPATRRWRHAADAATAPFRAAARPDRQRRPGPVESGPVADEAESMSVDDLGRLMWLLRRPPVVLAAALTALALVAGRSMLGSALHGGRLLPPAAGAADLWSSYVDGWHAVGLGSTTPAPPAVAVLALVSTLLLGKVWLAVDLLLLGAAPLAGLAAYAGAGALTRRRALRVAAGAAYAVSPPLTGAVAGGRIDVVAVLVLAPLTARAFAGAVRRGGVPAGAAAGLLLAACTAFAPIVWVVAAVAVLVGVLWSPAGPRAAAAAGAASLAVPPLVLVPWTWHVVAHPRLLVSGLGLPEPGTGTARVADLLLLHPGGPAMPQLWTWAGVVLAGAAALASRRVAARVGVVVWLAGVTAALVASRVATDLTGARFYPGAALAVALVGAAAAGVVAADEAPRALSSRSFGWRQVAAAGLAVAAVAGIAVDAVAWAVRGSDDPLSAGRASLLPVFAQAEAAAPTSPRVLVVRDRAGEVRYWLLRGAQGLRLGDAEVAATPSQHRLATNALSAAVADAAAGRPAAAAELASFGITLVVAPDSSNGQALRGLANVDGLARVPATATVVYRSTTPTGEAVVLTGEAAAAAAAGRALPMSARPQPLAAAPGHLHVEVPAATAPRLLVLAEPRSGAWHATLDGRRLVPRTAYGWAQAWELPNGGGVLTVGRAGGGRRDLLVVELVALALALATCVPTQREDR